jgi:hypothetical protein
MIAWREYTGNLSIKLLALALAFVLWLLAGGARETERNLLLPLTVKDLPRDMVVTGDLPRVMSVTVKGTRFRLIGLHPENMAVLLDLKGLGEGTATFGGMEKRLSLPPGVTVMRVFPSAIEVKLRRTAGTGNHQGAGP